MEKVQSEAASKNKARLIGRALEIAAAYNRRIV